MQALSKGFRSRNLYRINKSLDLKSYFIERNFKINKPIHKSYIVISVINSE